MDKGQHTGMILIDLEKAFDTLDHNVLLKQMECVGFKKPVIKWFKSNLSNKKCFVSIEGVFSEKFTNMWSSARFYSRITPFFNVY